MEASPFICLSPELRNVIYEFTFMSAYATKLQNGQIQHPLTRTCRQLRRETLLLSLSLTVFNAHLDDGPATPLAHWLKTIGSAHCLELREVKVWDLHMLNATLLGQRSMQHLMRPEQGPLFGQYILQPLGPWLLNRGWYLKDVVMALHEIGLGLRRLCRKNGPGADGFGEVGLTSVFALVELDAVSNGGDEAACLDDLMVHLGLDPSMRAQVKHALLNGDREVRLREGRRNIVFYFNGFRLLSMRQGFIPNDEDFVF